MLIFNENVYLKLFFRSYITISQRVLLKNNNFKRYFNTSLFLPSQKKLEVKPAFKVKKVVTEYGVVEVKQKVFVPKVTLISPDDNLQIVTLEEAEKIAKRRGLKLVKTVDWDSKTNRPTYNLMNAADYTEKSKHEKTSKPGNDKKDEKLLNVTSRITEHDLESKIKHIIKWLEKEHAVRVVISGDNGNLAPAEKIFDSISDSVKDLGRVVQKISKGGEIKFQIILPKKPKIKKAGVTKDFDDENVSDAEKVNPGSS